MTKTWKAPTYSIVTSLKPGHGRTHLKVLLQILSVLLSRLNCTRIFALVRKAKQQRGQLQLPPRDPLLECPGLLGLPEQLHWPLLPGMAHSSSISSYSFL